MAISFENANSPEVRENAESAREKLLERKLEQTREELEEVRKAARLGDALVGILLAKLEAAERERNTNPTTGLPNQRGLEGFFEERRSKSEAGTYVLMFVDIDRFKDINDTYGHAAGDAVLVEVGRRLQGMTRGGDIVTHPHGDEFEVIFTGASEGDLMGRIEAEKLVFDVEYGGKKIPVSLSAGLAAYIPGESLEDAKRRADQAMYVSKGKRDGGIVRYAEGEETGGKEKEKEENGLSITK